MQTSVPSSTPMPGSPELASKPLVASEDCMQATTDILPSSTPMPGSPELASKPLVASEDCMQATTDILPSSTPMPGSPELPPKRLAERMLSKSTLIDKESRIYKLPVREGRKCLSSAKIARCYVGDEPTGSGHLQEKVLMVVGATGAGKSTLINGIVNYILGVCWDDPFRFKMIVEHPSTQAVSVTSEITAYTIYYQEGSPFPYTFTIIDTPGFGDTKGLKRDKDITKQIKEFFSIPTTDGGIDHIDGIGFVTQASLARLTHTQKYIFDSILSIFGKDIGKNIFMMITFADGKKPPVVEAIKVGDIPFCKYFKFNNSALFPNFAEEDEDDNEDEGGDFDKMFWTMGMKSFGNFFKNFELVEPRSLQLTREVLEERQRLEIGVNGLQPQIDEGLAKIEEMRKEQKIMEEHEADIQTNKKFKYKITVTKQRKIDLQRGLYVTNCLRCNFTCHPSCIIADNNYKYNCGAMDGGGESSAKCRVCPGHCGWRSHVNNPYYFEIYKEEEERTSEELKKKYDAANQGKAKVQDLIREAESRLSQMDELVMDMILQVQRSLARLDEIALRPNQLSEVEYIDLMIKSEKSEHNIGWDDRVQYLQLARKQAQITAGIRTEITPEKEAANRESLWTKMKGWWNRK